MVGREKSNGACVNLPIRARLSLSPFTVVGALERHTLFARRSMGSFRFAIQAWPVSA